MGKWVELMNTQDIRVAILRIEGTNCEDETARAFSRLGAKPEIIHLKQLLGIDVRNQDKRSLSDYQCLMIPGGFSAGDYVRSGAIFSARMKGALRSELKDFVEKGYPVGGICNGFQILVELGLLPALDETMPDSPTASLRQNDSARFECRHVYLKQENTNCAWTKNIPSKKILEMPVAHGEGNFTLPSNLKEEHLKKLENNKQIVFRYSDVSGNTNAGYPWNPNGAISNIAGICNPKGNVFGMMPHPERVFDSWTHSAPGRINRGTTGDGRAVFESVLEYIKEMF